MKKNFISRANQWLIFLLLTIVTAAIVVASAMLFSYLRKEEIRRVNLISKAIRIQQELESPDPTIFELLIEIGESNNTIPVILMDEKNNPILHRNIPSEFENKPEKISEYAKIMGGKYPPIEIKQPDGNNQYVYYDNSPLLNNLQYSPYILGIFIFIYLLFSFGFMRILKKTDEGFLWAGLAKETAHQIGTPLSSMIGWLEIMRMENQNTEGVKELEKDVDRLKTISERFSKIGSVPELNDMNLSETVTQNFDYLKNRISTKVNFTYNAPKKDILNAHNRILMSWVIENLVKNAVDAMKGSGNLEVSLYEKGKNIIVDFKDSGCGMTKRQVSNAFKPGYSTKKRGWGLGLSLAKRVISEYHNGDIKIAQTEVGKGSTFRIILRNNN